MPQDQLAALIMALHSANQAQLPVTMVAAGLPQLVGQTGRAKSYAERLFEFVQIDRLDAAAARSVILYGLRGVGKTVLLNRMRLDAEARGLATVRIEAPEERSLPALLAPALRRALFQLRRIDGAKAGLQKAMRALAGFASALKVKYADIEVGLELDVEHGLADSGDLDADLSDLLATVGEAAAERGAAVVLFIDELQYVPQDQLAALIMALPAGPAARTAARR